MKTMRSGLALVLPNDSIDFTLNTGKKIRYGIVPWTAIQFFGM
jgi:hypothetical protein